MTIMPNVYTPTDLLEYALIGLEHRKAELTHAIARLRSSLQGSAPAPAKAKPRRKQGTMTSAGRRRVALSMKLRWAKAKRAGRKRLG